MASNGVMWMCNLREHYGRWRQMWQYDSRPSHRSVIHEAPQKPLTLLYCCRSLCRQCNGTDERYSNPRTLGALSASTSRGHCMVKHGIVVFLVILHGIAWKLITHDIIWSWVALITIAVIFNDWYDTGVGPSENTIGGIGIGIGGIGIAWYSMAL